MHYGFPPHRKSPEDLFLLHCTKCGSTSKELTCTEIKEVGYPWACQGTCGKYGVHFVRFHPTERARAYDVLGIAQPDKPR